MNNFALPENFMTDIATSTTSFFGALAPIYTLLLGIMLALFVVSFIFSYFKIDTKDDEE